MYKCISQESSYSQTDKQVYIFFTSSSLNESENIPIKETRLTIITLENA